MTGGLLPAVEAATATSVRAGAARAALAAAAAAGVEVREITGLEDLAAVERLYDGIWRRDAAPPVTAELMRALGKAGSYVAGAFEGAALVGACVAFFGAPTEQVLHSHITGVSAAVRGRSVGFALKLHQRAWALDRGLEAVAWTFDPLLRRNAHLNLAKLAAAPAEYLPNFYGGMRDGLNGADDSDRLLVHWSLAAQQVVAAAAGVSAPADAAAERSRGAVVAVGTSARGAPVPGPLDGEVCLVAVPGDVEAVRAADPGLAGEWRLAVREALATLMGTGGRVTGFDRAGWYVVRRSGS